MVVAVQTEWIVISGHKLFLTELFPTAAAQKTLLMPWLVTKHYPTWSYHLRNDHKKGDDHGMSFVILCFVHKWYFELPYHLVSGCLFPVIFLNQSKTKGYLDQIELMRIILIFLLQCYREEAGSWWAQEDEKDISPWFLCSSFSFLLVFKDLPLDLRYFLCYVLMFTYNF